MQQQPFEYYINRYLQGSITPEESIVLRGLLQDPQNDEALQQAMKTSWDEWGDHELSFPDIMQTLEHKVKAVQLSQDPAPVRPLPFLRRTWVRYAAAVVLLAGITTAILLSVDRQPKTPGTNEMAVTTPGILPGTNKAVLTIDDQDIHLSSDKTGIAVGASIAYTDGERLADAGKMIKLATPNGGQYQLVLPDGTKAWLNAASSISFPSVFNEGKRLIKITGEVYLEVAQDRSRTFTVDIDGQSTVQVLGTSFNINAYGDEGNIQTTLINGSVKILPAVTNEKTAPVDAKATAVILKPGQQAIQSVQAAAEPVKIINTPNPDQILAWKNGIFEFNGANLRQVMKQLERWYNIRVEYSNNMPDITFKGEFYRNVNLSDILEVLTEMGVKFRMEGKTLKVL